MQNVSNTPVLNKPTKIKRSLGERIGYFIIMLILTLFAFSTILTWALYSTRCWEFLLGYKAGKVFQVLFCLVLIVGATMQLDLVWAIADTLNGLMAIPNLIGVALLSPVVIKLCKEYFDMVKAGKK